mmetsp:Transcript_1642/g.2338  ORF Transcript_1642/g.2338 Transcript_1642/m.2338 type:complete len:844 (+) Transcript_1642:220-2751(+)|eukprot:CAMPEP_0184867828 /NCGR_PEP_ID=MMETSP0580-20130426/27874_1 /TAXON_ID=1118495 /ORGANISM="Dactyliosolen fragilissimus" /LENGTH=843 /DNA_ID=CAMNT_0027368299 /DNA_START=152 /DNA_END=2683 /DNA_ORIENTATION=-
MTSSSSSARGRGRGVSNAPAWMSSKRGDSGPGGNATISDRMTNSNRKEEVRMHGSSDHGERNNNRDSSSRMDREDGHKITSNSNGVAGNSGRDRDYGPDMDGYSEMGERGGRGGGYGYSNEYGRGPDRGDYGRPGRYYDSGRDGWGPGHGDSHGGYHGDDNNGPPHGEYGRRNNDMDRDRDRDRGGPPPRRGNGGRNNPPHLGWGDRYERDRYHNQHNHGGRGGYSEGPPPNSRRRGGRGHDFHHMNNNYNDDGGVLFHSEMEERVWLEERREKRKTRKTLFDVEPTEEQKALEEIQKAASASGNVGGFQSSISQGTGLGAEPQSSRSSSYGFGTSSAMGRSGLRSSRDGYNDRDSSGRSMSNHPQQTRHARRLYIGHLPAELSEDDVHSFFRASIETALKGITENKDEQDNKDSVFNKYIKDDPILSVYINQERRFAFVEFKTVEICTACLALDGINICQKGKVKIKRPNDYNPSHAPSINSSAELIIQKFDVSKLGIISSTVPDGPNKIFIGGLPYHLTESQVMELMGAFGAVKAFHLVKADSTATTSKGYGFVQYLDPNVTAVAVMGLNGMDMGGGKVLSARIAAQREDGAISGITDSDTSAHGGLSVLGVGTVAPIISSTSSTILGSVPPGVAPPIMKIVDGVDVEALVDFAMGIKNTAISTANNTSYYGEAATATALNTLVQTNEPLAVMQSTSNISTVDTSTILSVSNNADSNPISTNEMTTNTPSISSAPAQKSQTRVLVLLNMVMDEDFETDDDYNALFDEVKEESEKFGKMISMKIPRPTDNYAPSAIKKIYLEYSTVEDAMNAERELAGRQFGASTVTATFFDEYEYTKNNLF